MNMTEARAQITELGAQIRNAANEIRNAAATASMEELETLQANLTNMQTRMNSLQAAYDAEFGSMQNQQPAVNPVQERNLHEMLASREYARAFAHALRTGARPSRGMIAESDRILFDAMTIAGGTTPGEDGGFLVPEDIDNQIREIRRELNPLANLFNNESVSTNSGWRVMDTVPTAGMTALTAELADVPQDDQPKFVKIPFTLTTYGLIVPVSNELANDEVANLFGYLSRWFAKKQILTENKLLKAQLEALAAGQIAKTDDAIAALKTALNKELDPAISLSASILTNQDGYNYLDSLKDTNGRGLLQPDPTSATGMTFKGRPVVMASNALLPTRSVTSGTKGDYYPFYLGDFKEFATLFTRQPLEVTSTDIGGKAFTTNSIEVRGIARMCASTFDSSAVVRKEIFVPAE